MSSIVGDFAARLGLVPDEASWAKGDKLLAGIKMGLEALGAYELIHGAKEMIGSVVELGSTLNDTAQKTGISVEGLQFYGYVAKQNSSSIEELTQSSDKLSKSMADSAKTGSGPAVDGLELLHLSFSKINAMSPDQRIQAIATALAKMPDGAKKTAIAMDLFGRSGAALIPTLNDLGANGDALKKKFEDLGGGMSTQQAAQLDEFGDNIDSAKYSLTALKNTIVIAMLPALKSMLASFQEWIATNKATIAATVEGITTLMGYVFEAIGTIARGFAQSVAWLQEHTDVMYALLTGLGAAIAAFAVQAAIEWAIAFFPFVAIVGVIALVTLGLKKLFDYFTGGTSSWSEFLEEIRNQFVELGDFIWSIPDKIESAFGRAWSAIKAGAKAAFEWIINLPVIKQLIAVYNYFTKESGRTAAEPYGGNVGGKHYSGITDFVTGGSISRIENYGKPAGGGSAMSVTYAPNLTINPSAGMDEAAIGKAARGEIDRAWAEKMRAAKDALGGGVR